MMDEDYGGGATNCGVGACARTGGTQCAMASRGGSCTAGLAAGDDANCNGIDDDCDGHSDESLRRRRRPAAASAPARAPAP